MRCHSTLTLMCCCLHGFFFFSLFFPSLSTMQTNKRLSSHGATVRRPPDMRFLYLRHADIDPDLISHEIAPLTLMAPLDWKKKNYLLLMFLLPSEHEAPLPALTHFITFFLFFFSFFHIRSSKPTATVFALPAAFSFSVFFFWVGGTGG